MPLQLFLPECSLSSRGCRWGQLFPGAASIGRRLSGRGPSGGGGTHGTGAAGLLRRSGPSPGLPLGGPSGQPFSCEGGRLCAPRGLCAACPGPDRVPRPLGSLTRTSPSHVTQEAVARVRGEEGGSGPQRGFLEVLWWAPCGLLTEVLMPWARAPGAGPCGCCSGKQL